jgi:hypothetical protein
MDVFSYRRARFLLGLKVCDFVNHGHL